MRSFYIATYDCNNSIQCVTEYSGRDTFQIYVENENDFRTVPARASIDKLCDLLYDKGPGMGMRSHRRISRKEAIKHNQKYFRF